MDPTKIDQIKLDYYDLYTSNTATIVQKDAIDNVKRLLTQRCDYSCNKSTEYLFDTSKETMTQYQNPVMNVKLKITRFCNWLQSLRLYFWLEVFR